MSTKNSITTKRFVIRKSLIGTDTTISFTNKKDLSQCLAFNNMVTILIAMQYLPSLATYQKLLTLKK